MFNYIDLGAAPLDDIYERIDHWSHDAYVDNRGEWRKINNDVIIGLAQPFEQFSSSVGRQDFTCVDKARWQNRGEEGQASGRFDPKGVFKFGLVSHNLDKSST